MKSKVIALALAAGVSLCGCDFRTEHEKEMERIDAHIAKVKEELRLADEADKRLAPFDSSLKVNSLSTEDKKRLCGSDYERIAVGWPMRKALACAGRDLHVASDSAGGIRIWQSCDSNGRCLTVGEDKGFVASWNR